MMNLSGIAVRKLLKKTGLDSSRLIVLYDDIDIPVGRIRVRKKGGHGGHKGMKSIIASIGADDFPRVRLGIGGEHSDIVDYVLSGFSEEEGEKIERALSDSVDTIEMIVSGKIEEAMNKYN
jgi:PTH1 family peptidyl-tRNA hydrolase